MARRLIEQCLEQMDAVEYGSREFEIARFAAWHALTGAEREVLKKLLFNGPTWDGDVPSKAARDALLQLGLAVRCCFKGEQGYTAAAYNAYTIFPREEEASARRRGRA